MRKIIRFFVAVAVMTAIPVTGLAAAPAAYAGTGTPCSGTRCNGLDPTHSYNPSTGAECSANASTVLSENVLGGYLELRWGPNCQVNWTRFTPGDNDLYGIIVVNNTNGPWVGSGIDSIDFFQNSNGVVQWTSEVYAPDGPPPQLAGACVQDYTFNTGFICDNQ